jgi:hypothetical protein
LRLLSRRVFPTRRGAVVVWVIAPLGGRKTVFFLAKKTDLKTVVLAPSPVALLLKVALGSTHRALQDVVGFLHRI